MRYTVRLIVSAILISGCYYGPGLSPAESAAVSNSAKSLSLTPVIAERSAHYGGIVGGWILAPLVFSQMTSSPEIYCPPLPRITNLDHESNTRELQLIQAELESL